MIDVVIVPDFDGAASGIFEVRTLFFLASWIESSGEAGSFPLHVASIGEPPVSIRRLASLAGASITVHRPVEASGGGYSNKLRGLEIEATTGAILLLDADMLVVSDPSAIETMRGSIAIGPTGRPRLAAEDWQRVYAGLDMAPPEGRMSSLVGELAEPGRAPRKYREITPEYHAASILAPTDCGLRELWEQHTRRIRELFEPAEPHWKTITDSVEPGLATAVEALKTRGLPFVLLPHRFNVRWPHVVTGVVSFEDTSLLHLEGFPAPSADGSYISPASLLAAGRNYCDQFRRLHSGPRYRFEELLQYDEAAIRDYTARLEERLRLLYHRHISPVLQAS